jgi:predicted short-subunit dehydrogenase-like oxidoreductase (DUF2520 family)
MVRVFVIGTGNLGLHLINEFDAISQQPNATISLVGYHNRTSAIESDIKAQYYKNLEDIPPCNFVIIAVNDDNVKTVASQLDSTKSFTVVHTSGSVSVDALDAFENRGVFYWPQTFSKQREPDFSEITMCYEASNDVVREQVEIVGNTLSRKRKLINSTDRKKLHLAAVYTNNFVNHCYLKSYEYLEANKLSPELLRPLMKETLGKALDLHPLEAQTGPARRGDQKTIAQHLADLQHADCKMYEAITESIKNTYEKL